MKAAEVNAALAAMGVDRFLSALGLRGRKAGRQVRLACPIHGGSGANFVVGVRDGVIVWRCQSTCGRGGDAIALVEALRGVSFPEAVREAAALAGVYVAVERLEAPEDPKLVEVRRNAAEGVQRVLAALLELCPLEGEGLRYLTEDRGLSVETCRYAHVGYVSEPDRVRRVLVNGFPADVLDELGIVYRGEHLAFERHPLLFPILRNGRPIYVQGRALGPVAKKHERWRSMRGGVPSLYNLDALADDWRRPVMLCEGPVDTLSAHQWAPSYSAVGVFGAGSFKREWSAPLRGRDVVLAFDPDEAGDRGAMDVASELAAVGAVVRRMELPHGMDVNAWMLAEVA